MPLYDYRCTVCDREVEVMHGIHESGPETCAHCGGAMRKALSSPAIHFKGSGWAKKDAASKAKKSSPKPAADDSSKSSSDTADPAAKPAASEGGAKEKSTTSGAESKATSSAGSTTD